MLRVISSSPGELEPVFEAMLENALRICEAKFGNAAPLCDGGSSRRCMVGAPPASSTHCCASHLRPPPGVPLERMLRTKKVVHTLDAADEQTSRFRPDWPARVRISSCRCSRMNELIGAMSIYRQEVRPFTDKQIELVKNFAAQAVIAIENTRLLNELRQRTDDLSEALEQQTATSEVLQVISSSPGDLEPVFQAMLANASRICEAKFGNMYLRDGEAFRIAAAHNTPPALVEERRRVRLCPARNRPSAAWCRRGRWSISPTFAEPGYLERDPESVDRASSSVASGPFSSFRC